MIGAMLKKRRETLGLTQKFLADALKLDTPQFISNIERGVAFPPPPSLKKICSLYGLNYEAMAKMVVNEKAEHDKQKLQKKYRC